MFPELPIMKIENINTELDIRPQPEEPSTAPGIFSHLTYGYYVNCLC